MVSQSTIDEIRAAEAELREERIREGREAHCRALVRQAAHEIAAMLLPPGLTAWEFDLRCKLVEDRINHLVEQWPGEVE